MLFLIAGFDSCVESDNVVLTQEEYSKLANIPIPDYPKKVKINNIYCGFFRENNDEISYIIFYDSCEYIFMERSGGWRTSIYS